MTPRNGSARSRDRWNLLGGFLFPLWAIAWTLSMLIFRVDFGRFPALDWSMVALAAGALVLGIRACREMRVRWFVGAVLAFPALFSIAALVGEWTKFR